MKNLSYLIPNNQPMKDRYLLKAILVVGPHGSGKSYIMKSMFSRYSIRSVKSDFYFKRNLANYAEGFNLNQIIRHIDDLKQRILQEQNDEPEIKSAYWLDTMGPILMELTGNSEEVIYQNKTLLTKLAYDVSLVFIDTPLEMVIKRNSLRHTPLPVSLIKKAWAEVDINISAYEKRFGQNFYQIKNDVDYENNPQDERLFHFKLREKAREILNKPHTNRNARTMLELMWGLGLEYRSQLDPMLPELVETPQQ